MNNAALHLRPMGMPELLDQTISLYRRDFLKFIGIIAIPYIPLVLAQGVFSYFTTAMTSAANVNPLSLVSIGGMIVTAIVQFVLVNGIATAAMTRSIAGAYTGEHFDILASYTGLKDSWGRLILALIVMALLMVFASLWLIVPCVGWLTGVGLLVFLATTVMPLIAPVIVLEQKGVFSSIRRAWDLARLRFWWLIGYMLVITLFGQLIVTGPVFVASALLQGGFSAMDLSYQQTLIWTTIVQTLVGMVSSLLFTPLKLIAFTVAYMDLRARFEGLDLLMQQNHPAESTADVFLPQAAPSAPLQLFTWLDAGYFTLLSFATGAVYMIFGPFLILFAAMLIGLNVPQ